MPHIPNVDKCLVKSTMLLVDLHRSFQRLVIRNRNERPIDSTDHLGQKDVLGRSPQQVSPLRTSKAVDEARTFQTEENQLQKFLGNVFGSSRRIQLGLKLLW